MQRKITAADIYDVAEKAGVSKSTVSRVINKSHLVSETTRERVTTAMVELGYRPNTSARRLAGSPDRRIGLALPYFSGMFSSFYIHEILRGVGEIISEQDADLLVHIENPRLGGKMIDEKLRENGSTGGWLLADERVSVDTLKELISEHHPFVLLNRTVRLEKASWVVVDNVSGARVATEYLISLGHKRIAALTGSLVLQPAQERLNGYLDAMRDHGLEVPDEYVAHCNFQRDLAAQAMAAMLSLPTPPTAVFAASDLMAVGALDAATAAGVSVPHDLSIVGFDDDFVASQVTPRLTTVRQPLYDMGRQATLWLLGYIENEDQMPIRETLPATLVARESCARVE